MGRAFAVYGHRGARGLFAENTLPGFAAAIALGLRHIELDVALTADDVVVVTHDPCLNPVLTRDHGGKWLADTGPPIRQLSFAALRDYDVGRIRPGSDEAARFPAQQSADGARIPSLEEVLALDPSVTWLIELKTFPDRPGLTAAPEHMAECVLAVAAAQNASTRIIIESFDWRGPRQVRTHHPEIAVAWLTDHQNRREASAIAAEAGGAGNAARWVPQWAELNERVIAEAQALSLAVVPWDVNTPPEIARAIAWGVDGVITDRPDVALHSLAASA